MSKNSAHDIVIESLTEALLLLMETKAFKDISVSELCKKAGVGRVSFYRNFTAKQDILVRYLSDKTEVWWNEYSRKEPEEFYRDFWSELLGQYRQNEKLIRLLCKIHVAYILRDHIFACCGPKAQDDEKTAYIRALLAGMICGLVDEWVRRGMRDLPKDLNIHEIIQGTLRADAPL